MNEIINVTLNDNQEPIVSGRQLLRLLARTNSTLSTNSLIRSA